MPIFLLGDNEYEITKEEVDRQAMRLEPGLIAGRNYSVVVGGKVFPIKQLITEIVNMPSGAVTTMDAYTVLTKLGYEVEFKR